jgi:hypothetical protein
MPELKYRYPAIIGNTDISRQICNTEISCQNLEYKDMDHVRIWIKKERYMNLEYTVHIAGEILIKFYKHSNDFAFDYLSDSLWNRDFI